MNLRRALAGLASAVVGGAVAVASYPSVQAAAAPLIEEAAKQYPWAIPLAALLIGHLTGAAGEGGKDGGK